MTTLNRYGSQTLAMEIQHGDSGVGWQRVHLFRDIYLNIVVRNSKEHSTHVQKNNTYKHTIYCYMGISCL